MQLSITLAANVAQEFQEEADFFRVLDSAVNDLDVIFYKAGKEVSRAENITAGYGEKFTRGTFDKIRISSETGGAVSVATRLGNEISYDKPPTGNVTVTNQPATGGALSQWGITVTNSANYLVAGGSAARRFFSVQNKDGAGNLYLSFGAAATVANGIKIPPGGYFEAAIYAPTSSINLIGDIASNSNVVVITG